MKTNKSSWAFTLIELLVVISIIAILAGIALPVFSQVQEKGAQTKALSNGKQIGLALKLYATDNDGRFPSKALEDAGGGVIEEGATDVQNSNDAFAQLFPDYVQTESIFAVGKSGWSPTAPDELIDNPLPATRTQTLEQGENHWAYMLNLSDTSNAAYPLVADGFAEGNLTQPKYTNDETIKGGVWKGKKAVVIRADTSGSIEKLNQEYEVTRRTQSGTANLFTPAVNEGWMGSANKVVNPE